ncbi:hypothetical protein PG990_013545 [Apiospora arundinis]
MAPEKYPSVREEHDLFLWETGKFWDTKVLCKDVTMYLHKAILTRCHWFRFWYESHREPSNGLKYYVISFNQFWPGPLKTLLGFIYLTEIHNDYLQPTARPTRFDHPTFATLFNMGIFFDFPQFRDAMIDLGHKSMKNGLEYSQRNPTGDFPKCQIDELLSGAKKAYEGNKYAQAPLRSLYVSFFFQCYRNVQKDPNFYAALKRAPDFSVDLLEMLGLNDWEWDAIRAEKASSESDCSSTTTSYATTSSYDTARSSRTSRSSRSSRSRSSRSSYSTSSWSSF